MSEREDVPETGVVPALPTDLRLHRRTTFDDDAERYARTRPTYPPALFDVLAEAAGLREGSRVLEVAPGTGQATVSMAERGWRVTAVELGARMAALARRAVAAVPSADVEVVVSPFEDWPLPGEPFDAATGCWERFGQRDGNGGTRFTLTPEAAVDPATAEFERSGAFAEVSHRGFPLEVEYTTAQYLDLIGSYSQVAVLAPEAREGLLDGLRQLADDRFGGRITHRYLFQLVLARTPAS